jgi:hypothetical protein
MLQLRSLSAEKTDGPKYACISSDDTGLIFPFVQATGVFAQEFPVMAIENRRSINI